MEKTVRVLPVGDLSENCYLVYDAEGNGVFIDPGDEADFLLRAAAERGVSVKAVLLTHLHIDHFGAVPEILAATGAELILPEKEAPALTDPRRSLMVWRPAEERFSLTPDRLVGEGDRVTVGTLTFEVWETPGHTAGSVCYRCGDALFSGDTLFAGSVGRWDLPSGDEAALRRSLRRLAAVPDDCRVLPGHGGETTLLTEIRENPYMK